MRSTVAVRYGGPEVVEVVDRPAPVAGPRDVVISVRAAGLNPLDVKIRAGKVKAVMPLTPPIALGCDVAGVVTAIGSEVTRVAVGDEVYARLEKDRMGGLSEQVAADASVVARKPRTVSFAEAAALPLVSLTALQALREVGGAVAGQRVWITAGSGGVGAHAIQIAKILGLEVVTTTSGPNVAFVRSLGADEVVDYTTGPVVGRIAPVDLVFDVLGGQSELDALAVVRAGGVVVGIGGLPDAAFAHERLPWWARVAVGMATARRRAAERRTGSRFRYWFMRPDGAELDELAAWVDAGRLRPVIHRTYPFAELAEAFAELERGKARGKIVITF